MYPVKSLLTGAYTTTINPLWCQQLFWVLSLQDSSAKVSAHEISTYSGTLITTKVNDRHENNIKNFFISQIAKGAGEEWR